MEKCLVTKLQQLIVSFIKSVIRVTADPSFKEIAERKKNIPFKEIEQLDDFYDIAAIVNFLVKSR